MIQENKDRNSFPWTPPEDLSASPSMIQENKDRNAWGMLSSLLSLGGRPA